MQNEPEASDRQGQAVLAAPRKMSGDPLTKTAKASSTNTSSPTQEAFGSLKRNGLLSDGTLKLTGEIHASSSSSPAAEPSSTSPKLMTEDQEQELKVGVPLVFLTYRRPSEVQMFVDNILEELRTRGFNVRVLAGPSR